MLSAGSGGKEGAALPVLGGFDRRAARAARFSRPPVNLQLLREIPRFAVRLQKSRNVVPPCSIERCNTALMVFTSSSASALLNDPAGRSGKIPALNSDSLA